MSGFVFHRVVHRNHRHARFRREPCFRVRTLLQLLKRAVWIPPPAVAAGPLALCNPGVRAPSSRRSGRWIHTFLRSLTRSELLEQFKGVAVKTVQCRACPDCANLSPISDSFCRSFIFYSIDTEKGWMYGSSGENSERCRSDNVMLSGASQREKCLWGTLFAASILKKVTLIVQSHCLCCSWLTK